MNSTSLYNGENYFETWQYVCRKQEIHQYLGLELYEMRLFWTQVGGNIKWKLGMRNLHNHS
jgi:hypothetical protein